MKRFPEGWASHPPSQVPFLLRQWDDFAQRAPLSGVRILHNTPLSLETLIKLDVLIASGAEVAVVANQTIHPATEAIAVKAIRREGLPFFASAREVSGTWDIALDCSGKLADVPVTRGFVELTGSGTHLWQKRTPVKPVVSVDLSPIKTLETSLGTADGALRALALHTPLKERSVIIFGFGKVGKGLAKVLHNAGAKVTVVDANPISYASSPYPAFSMNDSRLSPIIAGADIALTATGVKDAISASFSPSLFRGKILANLGAEDEWGPAFSSEEVLNGKEALNFSLPDPTPMRYLDPSFFAHNQAALWLSNLSPGLHAPSPLFDAEVLSTWTKLFNEPLPVDFPLSLGL